VPAGQWPGVRPDRHAITRGSLPTPSGLVTSLDRFGVRHGNTAPSRNSHEFRYVFRPRSGGDCFPLPKSARGFGCHPTGPARGSSRGWRAKELLAQSDLPVAEIAASSGFGTAEYLATLFRRATGLTPLRYRSTVRGR
jgi:hypothetical protein